MFEIILANNHKNFLLFIMMRKNTDSDLNKYCTTFDILMQNHFFVIVTLS